VKKTQSGIFWKDVALVALVLIVIAESAALAFFLGPILPNLGKHTINVLVIGTPSENVMSLLETENYRIAGVNVTAVLADAQVTEETLSKADIVIMQGEEYCDRTLDAYASVPWDNFRKIKFIIIGNACSQSHSSNIAGWSALIYMSRQPEGIAGVIRYLSVASMPMKSTEWNGKFIVDAQDHEILNGIVNFEYSGRVWLFDRAHKGFVLASLSEGVPDMESQITGRYSSTPAIVNVNIGFGSTVYFAFDPSTTSRNMFLNTLLYLSNK